MDRTVQQATTGEAHAVDLGKSSADQVGKKVGAPGGNLALAVTLRVELLAGRVIGRSLLHR